MRYVLDTNIWSKWAIEEQPLTNRVELASERGIGITVVTACEAFYGWGKAARNKPKEKWVEIYDAMMREIRFMRDAAVLPFTQATLELYEQLNADYRNPGKADLRIAAIAIENELILVTHNTRDFNRIQELEIQDWVRNDPE